MTCRVEDSITYLQTYNAENRIASIIKLASPSGSCAAPGNYASKWDFAYDGDGTRTATLHTPYNAGAPQTAVLTAYYFGGSYEVTNGVAKKYYSFGGQTMMRDANGLQYFLTDHLDSTVAVTNASGTLTSQQRYLPFGQVRTDLSAPQYRISSTDFGYTGQRDLDPGMGGLMDYKARFYSPYINHFTQPDTIVPDLYNPQALNRYAYTLNNPIRYNDPSGHMATDDNQEGGCQDLHLCKKNYLHRRSKEIVKSLQGKEGRDDLEAMADIIDLGSTLFKTNEELIPVLSSVFLGSEESNSWTVWNVSQFGKNQHPCAAVGRDVNDCAANAVTGSFGDEGFNLDFQDQASQPFHFWAFLATTANTEGVGPASYVPGRVVGFWANVGHELVIQEAGSTWQDYALSRAGMNIGTLVNMGMIPPDQLGNTIRTYVGTNGPGAPYVDSLVAIIPLLGNR